MTRDELKLYDGRNGSKAYVAYKGRVYDVTNSSMWKDGQHQGMHSAGLDLTPMLADAPHGSEVFKGFTVVGILQEDKTEVTNKENLRVWYKKFHPHPMVAHFPIVLHIFATLLDLLFFVTPKEIYALGVFYMFLIATVFGFIAMIPGVLSWWINYNFSSSRPFIVKIIVATLTLLLGVVGIVLYYANPAIVYEASLEGIIYHFIIILTGINVIVLGYYGGKITWGDSFGYTDEKLEVKELEQIPTSSQKLLSAGRYNLPFMHESTSCAIMLMQKKTEVTVTDEYSSLSILIGGAAGTGIETLEKILSDSFKRSGFYIFSTKEYMSRVRGGSNTILIRISDVPIEAPCWEVDLYVAIDAKALQHAKERFTNNTLIIVDDMFAEQNKDAVAIAMTESAKKLGNAKYKNTYVAGVIFGLLGTEVEPLQESVEKHFKDDNINMRALKIGFEAGVKLDSSKLPLLPQKNKQELEKLHLMDGTTASGFGFLNGGCNFVASYPMSPSTGVLNFMASMSKNLEIAVEQSEDEIASLHMVLGAWYAGARALTTTSGGGFALMGEALSLSGMSETPAVIYLAQRPGPATGMPTRTEQGDLNMALHSGHGAFARLLLAPGSLKECIDYGYLAFELADRYQIPVIFLIDQYLTDSVTMIEDVDFSEYEQRRYIIETDEDYKRYIDTQNGVSPRGIPGFGDGLVCAEGHEHDERSQITEAYNKRVQMASKRSRKEEALVAQAIAPECYGDGSIAIIGWGSTRGAIAEALKVLDNSRLTQVHFVWVYPLNPEHLEFLKDFEYIIVVENNTDGAFCDRLKIHGVKVDSQILQFNGFAFFADQLKNMILDTLKDL